ncbi:MAG: hypothetical protein KA362_12680 [Chloroflexi bacterium]|nr:hypothetical protein [Chloroflexota bacterium]MBK6711161.1 hypothetical protein [Chloroflexota bacterium]MBK7176162.1 hypothetical protein [Chloroflexota bacterium]MBK7915959.1 hypothetical protein [Chloroflexota bacterium]MBK8931056.1 hypothetical protein [Chloroflexota bacterium]
MYQKTKWIIAALFVLGFVALTACNNDASSPTAAPTEISAPIIENTSQAGEQDDAAYPGLEPQLETPNPGYPVEEPTQAVINIPQPDLPLQLAPSEIGATVGGIVVDAKSQEAPPESIIYLGRMQYTEKGFPVVSLNRQEAPFVILPKNGGFIFENIEPGEYSLVFVTPDYSFLVADQDEVTIVFTVAEGDVLDLGTMLVQTP